MPILQLLINQRLLCGVLSPLFHPNSCPDSFITMYSMLGQLVAKHGPDVAFAVLTKVGLQFFLCALVVFTDLNFAV